MPLRLLPAATDRQTTSSLLLPVFLENTIVNCAIKSAVGAITYVNLISVITVMENI